MEVSIHFSTDNAAFEDDREGEINRILARVFEEIKMGREEGICRDFNGNKVGEWDVVLTDE